MKTVLASGGGGIKGLVEARFLAAIGPVAPDLVVGTSTGGILAAAIGLGKDVATLPELYQKHGATIFEKRKLAGLWRAKYSNEGLRKVLLEQFGEKRMGDCVIPTMVVSQWKANNTLSLIQSWRDRDFPIVDACLCTSAAPTFFPAHLGRIDGGMARNNPCGVAMVEALKQFANSPFRLLSIGCPRAMSGSDPTDGDWGVVRWMLHGLIDAFMDSGVDASAYEADVAMQALGFPFLHIEPDHDALGTLAMDDASPRSLARLNDIANRLIDKYASEARNFLRD